MSKKEYMFDVHPSEDMYQCYLPSKTLSAKTEFTQYKKSKIKLIKKGRYYEKYNLMYEKKFIEQELSYNKEINNLKLQLVSSQAERDIAKKDKEIAELKLQLLLK